MSANSRLGAYSNKYGIINNIYLNAISLSLQTSVFCSDSTHLSATNRKIIFCYTDLHLFRSSGYTIYTLDKNVNNQHTCKNGQLYCKAKQDKKINFTKGQGVSLLKG